MTGNNGARLKVLLKMDNPFDYQAFATACKIEGIIPMSAMEYAQKMGLCLVAKFVYPDEDVDKAYIKFITNPEYMPKFENAKQPNGETGCCGGGRVR